MINRISHVGIVVEDLDQAIELWSGAFGLEVRQRMEVAVEGVRNALLAPPGAAEGSFFIELMEPVDKDDRTNAIARRLAAAGEGVYHLAVATEDVVASGDELAARGLQILKLAPVVDGQAGRRVVHPKSANGVLIEILQERRETS